VSFTVLVEIKKPSTNLLHNEYRNGAWGASEDLTGGISQMHANSLQWEVEGATTDANRDLVENERGAFTVRPKSILIIGRTSSLNTRDKKKSFEIFRRNLKNPEILTFDELLERARFIISESGQNE
jgi:hypothetical protein